MQPDIVTRLLALNRSFYEQLAGPFARTRAHPQPGFARLLPFLPQPCTRVLDVGCGEGRFGRFLAKSGVEAEYVGVDFSSGLLAEAEAAVADSFAHTSFVARNLARPEALDGLGTFSLIACLAVLQHIPGRANRLRLLREMAQQLEPGGRLFLSTWQFMDSPRQRRKLAPWAEAGLEGAAVEAGDHLLTWQSGGFGLRYVAAIDAEETAALAEAAGLSILHQFRSDGREGELNLYTVLAQ